jgi:hypothetical protein
MTPIEKALVLILEDIASKRGGEAYCWVINQHFSKREDAVTAKALARKSYDEVIAELRQ